MGGNTIIEKKRIIIIPKSFIMNPTLTKSIILTLPLENIIALGGVAKKIKFISEYVENKIYQ